MNYTLIFFAILIVVTSVGALFQDKAVDLNRGKKVYDTYCATCHGKQGKGDGPGAAALKPKPRDFTDKNYMEKLKDDYLFKIISDGGASVGKSPLMPAWKTSIKKEDINNVIAYIRTFAPSKKTIQNTSMFIP